MAGSQGRGRSNSLPSHVVEYLKAWLLSDEHLLHPYPTDSEKQQLCAATGLDLKRLQNWFVNARGRIWKKEYEARVKQEKQEQQEMDPRNSVASTLKTAPAQPPSSEEKYTQVSDAIAQTNGTIETIPRFVSLVSPSPTGRLIHQVSDASLNSNDGNSSSSSSVDGDEHDFCGITSFEKRAAGEDTPFIFQQRPHKRPRVVSQDATFSEPPRYARKNPEEWKQACIRSRRLDDQSLPTLDEAACLFGYSV